MSFSIAAAIKASRRNPICLRFIGRVPLLLPLRPTPYYYIRPANRITQ